MTRRADIVKRNRRIKNYAIAGYTRGQIAKLVHLHVNSVAEILRSFVVRGKLMEVPNSSPRIYYDPRECAIEQTVDSDEQNDVYVENIHDATEKGFLNSLPEGETKPIWTDGMMTREEWIGVMFPLLKAEGVNQTQTCKAFHMDHRRLKKLVLEMGGKFDEEAEGDVQDRGGGEAAKP